MDGGWADPRRRHRGGSRALTHRRGGRRVPAAEERGRRLTQGAMPVPRGENTLVQRHPRTRTFLLFFVCRGRRRDQVRAEDRRAQLRRGRRAAGRPGRHRPALRAGRLRTGAGTEPAAQADRRAPGRRRILCRTTGRIRCRARSCLPGRSRFRARRCPAVRRRLLAEGVGRPDQAPARTRLHRQRPDQRGPGHPGQPRAAGQVPRPADVAHPRPVRRRHRVRRPQAGRAGRRAQVPQHAGDLAVPQEHRAVRGGPGQARDRAAQAGGHRGGLHRRDGLPPGRGADRGGYLRHLVRRGSHQGAAPADHGHARDPSAR